MEKMTNIGSSRKVLIIVENLPVPFDRRVWQEANALNDAGYHVSVICPAIKNYEKRYENINGIKIYRHPLLIEGSGAFGYFIEYSTATLWQFLLALKIRRTVGFDVIQACNPPDTIFLVGLFFKLFFGTLFVFDHHDINPELYIAKFRRRDLFYRLMILLERLTFKVSDCSIATNHSYRKIAIKRGIMRPDKVTVVRSGPSLDRVQKFPTNDQWKKNRLYLVGYVGVMGEQEGIDHLIEAARVIVYEEDRKDVQFVLIGDGTSRALMEDLTAENRLSDYITFTGRVSDGIMLEILSTADVCVNPDIANSMNDKSTMNKIMEYMALGKPIVQYDLIEGRYSAREASIYAERNNPRSLARKILYLLDNAAVRMEMGTFGENRVKTELHWGIEKPKYLNVYRSLFNEKITKM